MRRVVKLFIIVVIVGLVSSCVKENHVCYRFEVCNVTETPITIHLSSWGGYSMYINEMYDSKYKFHDLETIEPHSSLIFSTEVGGDPDPYKIPSSLIPAWKYITAIECGGEAIAKEYFNDPENWKLSVARQMNGTFTHIRLLIEKQK